MTVSTTSKITRLLPSAIHQLCDTPAEAVEYLEHYDICVVTWLIWLLCAPADDITVVSEIGDT